MQTAHEEAGYRPEPQPCSTRKISERELRREFRTYHELTAQERVHDYLIYYCVIEGEIRIDTRVFHFQERPENLLDTDYPDGKPHQLGGKHTDHDSV